MEISVKEALQFGWETFKKRSWFLIGAFFLLFLISITLNASLEYLFPSDEPATLLGLVAGFVTFVISVLLEMGIIALAIKTHDAAESVTLSDGWHPNQFLSYAIGQMSVGIAVIIGLVLLIIPGIILALAFLFTPYLIIEGRGPFEAMKESAEITKGHRSRLLLLMGAITLLNLCGLLAFFVGVFVTAPISVLAVAHAYRTLSKKDEKLATP